MVSDCAHCGVYACRAGQFEASPANCPMKDQGFPAFGDLYGEPESRRMAYEAARIEADAPYR